MNKNTDYPILEKETRISCGPMFFSAGGGLLDSYTGNLWGGYGLSKLFSNSYRSIRVRRSSDNTEQDIGFVDSSLSTTSLLSFVGSNDGFITIWYDQGPGGNHLNQSTQSLQAKIVDAGVYLQEIIWDGTDDNFITANSNSGTKFTIIWAGHNRLGVAAASENINFRYDDSYATSSVNRNTTTFPNTIYGMILSTGSTNLQASYLTQGIPSSDKSVYASVFDWTLANTGQLKYYIDGVSQTGSFTGSTTTGTFASSRYCVGGSTNSYNRFACKTFLIYNNALSGTAVSAISTLIKPTPRTLGLDSFTTGLWGLYSLRKQLSSYSGYCIKVRRSNDNTEQDIGFVNNFLDTASLLSFTGSNSAYIKTWYDQSGAAHDFSQSVTTANQPRIVNAGVVDYAIIFDGSNDIMSTGASGTPTAMTVFFKARTLVSQLAVILEQNTDVNTLRGFATFTQSNTLYGYLSGTSGNTNHVDSYSNAWPSGNTCAFKLDRSQSTSATKLKGYSGGKSLTMTPTTVGTLSGDFISANWYLGARSGSLYPFNGGVESVVIYESSVADADIERISCALG